MKLIEKLSEEWVHGEDCEVMDTWRAHKESFEAGFRKAREMILTLTDDVGGRHHDSWMYVRIQNLGESEVG
jgi:hypothetical protein